MGSYYTLLGVEPDATPDAIAAAYQQQRERYDPARVVDLDPELRATAVERSQALEQAYAILSDPIRRQEYDASLFDAASNGRTPASNPRRGLSSRERTYALVGVVLAFALVATIWVLTGSDSEGVAGQAMPQMNRVAPEFTLQTLDGTPLSLSDFQGQVVLLNFWGTWCEPCKRELPALEQAHQQYHEQGLVVIGVNLTHSERAQGGDAATVQAFLEQFGVTYPNVLDLEGAVTNAYRVFPLPTSFFVDQTGYIRYVHIGELRFQDVEARFLELLRRAHGEADNFDS
ncbi:redoxin domain-containing protein [Candidatus Viridilinea mediisalina]|uniref:DnaJ homolog subfamily C member 10 n=1 Tax=Candidatus Viridilinea mediisalina TaxID=2024553 RepID=A0A2A6RJS2_9CHLR|nr:redoxin domain-containing protein [Candidatus Viridilinea mediisalina]PDW03317.1 alkyl hydroperoxide reductase [Candidatus Viridilinea mediisalina]